jgi:type II secretory pathway component GspD/PulD (secretin)
VKTAALHGLLTLAAVASWPVHTSAATPAVLAPSQAAQDEPSALDPKAALLSLLDFPSSLLGGTPMEQLLSQPLPGQGPAGELPSQSPGIGEFRLSTNNRLDFHAREIGVADAFSQLRTLVQRNIVLAPGIEALFTGDLYDLDVDETIEAICRSTGLVAHYEGSFIYVEPDEQMSRIFELQYVRGEDLVQLVVPLLSETGKVSATLPASVGIVPSQEEAGGDEYASRDILLVFDYPSVLDDVSQVVAVLDVRPKQVLIEATILAATLTDEFAAGIDFNLLKGVNFEDVGATSTNGTSVDYGGFTSEQLAAGAGAADTDLTSLLPTGGLNLGYLNHGTGIFIRALQQLTDTTILANPRIIAINKQRGEVLLGRRDGFLTSIVTQTSTTQRVEYLETGTRLVFRPYIGEDEFIRLEIHPEDSDGGVTADGLPFKETAEVTTNVMVKSGQSIVIGGLFRERVQAVEKKVPWLGDIPYLGVLFRSTDEIATREEIIVMLTPHILDAADSPETLVSAGGLVDASTLAGSYVYTARSMLGHDQYGAALMFLEAGQRLDPMRREIESLKRDVFGSIVPAIAQRSIDGLILDAILAQDPAQRPAASTPDVHDGLPLGTEDGR